MPRYRLLSAVTALSGAGLLLLVASQAALALDTTLENVTMEKTEAGQTGKVVFKRIEVTGTNLTQDEVAKLFAGATPDAERKAIAARMTATRIAIPEAVATSKDATFTATGFVAENIDKGKVGHMALAGITGEADVKDAGKATFRSGAFVLDGGSLLGMIEPGSVGDLAAASHLSWQGLDVTMPDKDTPAGAPGGNAYRITMASFTADGTSDGKVPLTAHGKLDHLVIVPPPQSKAGMGLAMAGYDKLDFGVTFASVYDPAARTFRLDDYTLTGAGMGSIGLSGLASSIAPTLFTGKREDKLGAVMQGALNSLKIHVVNAGLFEKALTVYAQQQGRQPDDIKAEWTGMATQFVPLMLGGDPNALKVAGALAAFISAPKELTVTATARGAPVPFLDFAQIRDPAAFMKLVAIDAVSAGGQAAVPAPAAPPAVAAPAAPGTMTGLAAWGALVGNTVLGQNADGEPLAQFFARNGAVKQDEAGDKTAGKWAVEGELVCLTFPDDDPTCYHVTVNGRTATFADEEGGRLKFEILSGNARGL